MKNQVYEMHTVCKKNLGSRNQEKLWQSTNVTMDTNIS